MARRGETEGIGRSLLPGFAEKLEEESVVFGICLACPIKKPGQDTSLISYMLVTVVYLVYEYQRFCHALLPLNFGKGIARG